MIPVANAEKCEGPILSASPFLKLDWAKLRRQKKLLLKLANTFMEDRRYQEAGQITGVLNLLDTIQEYGVEKLGLDPSEVWGDLDA